MPVVGETLTSTTGTFSGGEGSITVTDTIKKSPTGSSNWSNATSGNSYTLTEADDGLYFRATSRATDEAGQSINSNSAVVGPVTTPIVYDDLALVSPPTLSGEAKVGSTITGTKAVYSGGVPPVEVQSQIQKSDSANGGSWSGVDGWGSENAGTHHIGANEVGKYFRVAGRAVDSSEGAVAKAETLMSFSNVIGPATQSTIGGVVVVVDDEVVEYGTPVHVVANNPAHVEVTITGDAEPTYKWEARGDYPLMVGQHAATTTLTFPQEGNATVTLTITDSSSSDSPITYAMNFYVASQAEWDALHPDA